MNPPRRSGAGPLTRHPLLATVQFHYQRVTEGDPVVSEPSTRIDRWALWSLKARAVVVVLTVEVLALAMLGRSVATLVIGTDTLLLTAGLTAFGILHTELATGIERMRRRVADTSYFDLSSVWTFAAALLLPPAAAGVVIVVVYTHLWLRVWKPARVPLYRHVYTTATVVLAAHVAHAVVAGGGGVPAWPQDLVGLSTLGVALLAYIVVNTVLVAGAIALTEPVVRPAELLGQRDDIALEIATLCLGALAAVALTANPWLVVLVLPPLLVLHRAVLVRQLEAVASTDAKTGLLTAGAWHTLAARELRRARRSGRASAVLVLDLDHFKAVNDRHGHIVGDDVLRAVAAALRAEVREGDLVGRFGGEEFVVLLPDLPAEHADRTELPMIAERLRRCVSRLDVRSDSADGPLTVAGLTISVGVATHPADGATLEQVLKVADAALYTAKHAGRNVVCIAPPPAIPAARRPSP